MAQKAYKCKKCNEEKIVNASEETPRCCGEPMYEIPLQSCTKPYNPESARLDDDDDACDDGVH